MIEQTDKDDFALARGIGNPTPSRLRETIFEPAGDMRRLGLMNEATHEKITLRRSGKHHARGLPNA